MFIKCLALQLCRTHTLFSIFSLNHCVSISVFHFICTALYLFVYLKQNLCFNWGKLKVILCNGWNSKNLARISALVYVRIENEKWIGWNEHENYPVIVNSMTLYRCGEHGTNCHTVTVAYTLHIYTQSSIHCYLIMMTNMNLHRSKGSGNKQFLLM